jgi:Methyltransferase domain
VGVDADADMIREAKTVSASNARFVHLRAEELPGELGAFDVVLFAQSFHWMVQEVVARTAHAMLRPGGAVVHVGATTHRGEGDVPYEEIDELVRSYLGPVRRAGAGSLPDGTARWEDEAFAAAGFTGPQRLEVPARRHVRTAEEIVASVFSQSSAAPHLFGDRLDDFERELRAVVGDGPFSERFRAIGLSIWRR